MPLNLRQNQSTPLTTAQMDGNLTLLEGQYKGPATTSTNPTAEKGFYYLATTPGTYTNFGGLTVENEIAYLRHTGTGWVKDVAYNLATTNHTAGRAISGAIYPVPTNAGATYTFRVAPKTVVETWGTTRLESWPADSTPASTSRSMLRRAVTAGDLDIVAPTTGGYIFVTTAGALAHSATVSGIPQGAIVLLYRVGQYNPYYTLLPSNHQFGQYHNNLDCVPIPTEAFNIKSFGVVGDGVADDTWVIPLLNALSRRFFDGNGYFAGPVYRKALRPFTIHFPAGTYQMDLPTHGAINNYAIWKFIGDGKTATTLRPYTNPETLAPAGSGLSAPGFVEHMGFYNIRGPSGVFPFGVEIKDAKFSFPVGTAYNATYLCRPDAPYSRFERVDFDYQGGVYSALWPYNYNQIDIIDCTFAANEVGKAWHAVRINGPKSRDSRATIRGNVIYNGVTGIIVMSDRSRPIENVLIENNRVYRCGDESISFDAVGNDKNLCAVICNGPITHASNNATDKRLRIGLTKTYVTAFSSGSGATTSTYTLASRSDWTNFYLSLDDDSGREGTVHRIIGTETTGSDEVFILDTYTPASDINIGGWAGVQAGFFNCTVRNNLIIGSVGAPDAGNSNTTTWPCGYGTGLSIYLNVFNSVIENNVVMSCANGLMLVGGLMMNTYRTRVYNNVVRGNRFINCMESPRTSDGGYTYPEHAAVRFDSLYANNFYQYNNVFAGNVVVGGKLIQFKNQKNFVFENNVIERVAELRFRYCGNTLPTADSTRLGQRFMLITDNASGVPTAVTYYVCKLSGGSYSWVEV